MVERGTLSFDGSGQAHTEDQHDAEDAPVG